MQDEINAGSEQDEKRTLLGIFEGYIANANIERIYLYSFA